MRIWSTFGGAYARGEDMDKQMNRSLWRENNWKVALVGIVLFVVLGPALGLFAFTPQVMTLLPVALLALLGYGGVIGTGVCSAVLIGMGFALFGIWGALCVALLLLPTVIAAAYTLDREYPFWVGVAAGCTAMFVSMSVAIMILSALAGSDVVTALSSMVRQMLEESGSLGDMLLSLMMQMGLIGEADEAINVLGRPFFTASMRAELIGELVNVLDAMLRLELPMQMATGSVAAGLLGQAALRKGVLSRGVKVDYPPLRTWRVPSGWGRVLGGTLAALYVLVMLVSGRLDSMFYVFSGVFDQVFAIQGVASVCYMLHKRGKGRGWQMLVFLLGYFMLRPAAVMIGVLDQAMDIGHRRAELDEDEKKINPFDPRAQL